MLLSADQVAGFRREGVLFPQRALANGDALRRTAALQGFAQARGAPLTGRLRFKAHLRFRALEEAAPAA